MNPTSLVPLAFAAMLTVAWAGTAAGADRADGDAAGALPLRIWGSPADRELLESLGEAFRRYHPQADFRYQLHGPESTIAGVYTGVADLAVMARELREPLERMAFEWALLSKPWEIEFAHAGFDPAAPGSQLAVFVHADNPLESISLVELDAILGTERRRGGRAIDAWSDLRGGDGDAAVDVYGPPIDSVAALFIRQRVLHDSQKWNPGYHECSTREEALRALAADPAGLAVAAFGPAPDGVRPLALSEEDGGAAFLPTEDTVRDRSYPLWRVRTIVVRRPPGERLDSGIEEFLRFVLGPEGQGLIASDSRLFALAAPEARRQLERLRQ